MFLPRESGPGPAVVLAAGLGGLGNAVLMSRADYDAMQETAYLLRSPANARRLMESYAQAEAGEYTEHELDRDP